MPAPLFVWGTIEDLSNTGIWTRASGAGVATSGSNSPFGSTTGVYGVSNTAASQSSITRTITVPSATAHVVPIFVRSVDAANVGIQVGSGATSGTLQVNFTAGAVTSVAQESVTGGVTVSGAFVNVGTGGQVQAPWALILVSLRGLSAGSGTLRLYPNLTGFASAQSSLFYVRPTFTHGYNLDNALAQPIARGGSSVVRSPSGVEDAWDYGTDELLTGALRWMPRDFLADPPCSGFDGNGTDLVGVGCRSLLRAGRQRQTIRYVRDRADCTAYVDGYLTEPYDSATGTVEPDGTISLPITLKSTTPYRGEL